MIFSVTETQQQIAAIALEEAARTAAQAPRPPEPAVTVQVSGGAMPAPGPVPAMAVKAAEPDVSKRRKGKGKGRERAGRDMLPGEAGPGLVGEGMAAVADDAGAAKTVAPEGPGRGMRTGPGEPPASYDRGYLTEGHAAPSPQHGPSLQNPLAGIPGYVPPSAPQVAAIPPAVIDRYTLRSPSE